MRLKALKHSKESRDIFLSCVLFFILCLSTMIVQANECDDQYVNGERPIAINPSLQKGLQPVCSPNGFEAMHWGPSRTGLWAAEHLTTERVRAGKKLSRKDAFHEEESIPASSRATLNDYKRSGMDRGHLAPNKDMGDLRTQADCFSLANIVPQDSNNNQNLWEGIESAVRSYVMSHGDVYIITGPIFPGHGQQAKWLKGRVLIPIQMYKIVYDPRTRKAAAYLAQNQPGMEWENKSIAEISEIAQIDFFPWMTKKQKQVKLDLPTPTPHGKTLGAKNSGGDSLSHQVNNLFKLLQ